MADPIDITPLITKRHLAEADRHASALRDRLTEWLTVLDTQELLTAYSLLMPLVYSVAREEAERKKLDQDPEPPQAS